MDSTFASGFRGDTGAARRRRHCMDRCEALQNLKELASLEVLNLYGAQVTDAGVPQLNELTRLRWLDLRNTQVTDSGIADLIETLPNVEIMK
jgi:hypothetical protein